MSAARRAFGDLKNVSFTPMDAKSASVQRKVQDGTKSQQRAKNMDAFATPVIGKEFIRDLNKNAGRLSDIDPDMRCSYLPLKDEYRDCIARERELSEAPLKLDEILEDDFLSCNAGSPFDDLIAEEFRSLRNEHG